MRSIRLLLCLGCFTLGCNSSKEGVGSGGGEDLAVSADLSSTLPDMSMAPTTPLGCAGVIQCLMGAGAGGMASCLTRATPHAAMLLGALVDCGKAACESSDGGSGSCSGPQDQSQTCLQCAVQDVQSGDCMTEVQACLSDH
jgi:hypothetical protein